MAIMVPLQEGHGWRRVWLSGTSSRLASPPSGSASGDSAWSSRRMVVMFRTRALLAKRP